MHVCTRANPGGGAHPCCTAPIAHGSGLVLRTGGALGCRRLRCAGRGARMYCAHSSSCARHRTARRIAGLEQSVRRASVRACVQMHSALRAFKAHKRSGTPLFRKGTVRCRAGEHHGGQSGSHSRVYFRGSCLNCACCPNRVVRTSLLVAVVRESDIASRGAHAAWGALVHHAQVCQCAPWPLLNLECSCAPPLHAAFCSQVASNEAVPSKRAPWPGESGPLGLPPRRPLIADKVTVGCF